MFFEAKKDFNIDLSKSIMLGDKISDMKAGFSSGIKNLLLLSDAEKYSYSKNIKSLKDAIIYLK